MVIQYSNFLLAFNCRYKYHRWTRALYYLNIAVPQILGLRIKIDRKAMRVNVSIHLTTPNYYGLKLCNLHAESYQIQSAQLARVCVSNRQYIKLIFYIIIGVNTGNYIVLLFQQEDNARVNSVRIRFCMCTLFLSWVINLQHDGV